VQIKDKATTADGCLSIDLVHLEPAAATTESTDR